jgi:hypothetical protein
MKYVVALLDCGGETLTRMSIDKNGHIVSWLPSSYLVEYKEQMIKDGDTPSSLKMVTDVINVIVLFHRPHKWYENYIVGYSMWHCPSRWVLDFKYKGPSAILECVQEACHNLSQCELDPTLRKYVDDIKLRYDAEMSRWTEPNLPQAEEEVETGIKSKEIDHKWSAIAEIIGVLPNYNDFMSSETEDNQKVQVRNLAFFYAVAQERENVGNLAYFYDDE